jgi:hypothetical protein
LGKTKSPRRARHIERPKAFLAAAGQDNLLGRLFSAYLNAVCSVRVVLHGSACAFGASHRRNPTTLLAIADEVIE